MRMDTNEEMEIAFSKFLKEKGLSFTLKTLARACCVEWMNSEDHPETLQNRMIEKFWKMAEKRIDELANEIGEGIIGS